jgi:xylulose-5-phosphate/fructose-6-phosphate phosphoketolase
MRLDADIGLLTVWRQDHNGFTHQDPGFLDVIANKSPAVVRIYLPPDANTLLSSMSHCLASENYVNVIVADKQDHLQFLDMKSAIAHCTKGLGIWEWACNHPDEEPDLVMACAGDTVTAEALAATALLREHVPEIRVRFVNVVDLFRLISIDDHPHGLTDLEFDALFTRDKPVIFNFHSYPWLIHRFTYRRNGSRNIHVNGYREKGNIDTPLELAIRNGVDRFSLTIQAIDQLGLKGTLKGRAGMVRERLKEKRLEARNYAFENGIDRVLVKVREGLGLGDGSGGEAEKR